MYIAVYLLNRLPTKAVDGMTPIEAWSGVKPSAKHLRTFGSMCYIYVPSVKRSKLDQKADQGIFLGYFTMSKGYRVYNLQSHKITVNKDVVVDESSHRNWEKKLPEKDEVVHQSIPAANSSSKDDVVDSNDSPLDSPILKTKSLSEIYEKCNLAMLEPSSFDEAVMCGKWRTIMKEGIGMIEKKTRHGGWWIGLKIKISLELNGYSEQN